MDLATTLKKTIRSVPDFPKKGIMFRDITPLLSDIKIFQQITKALCEAAPKETNCIAAIEARGFFFGVAIASALNIPFVPIRKKGKLPYKTISAEYELEYGTDSLYMHQDALDSHSKVYLIDDLIATGGSFVAAISLIHQLKASITKAGCIIELEFLKGKEKIAPIPFTSLVVY